MDPQRVRVHTKHRLAPILTIPKLLECSLLHLTSLLSLDCGHFGVSLMPVFFHMFCPNVLYFQTTVDCWAFFAPPCICFKQMDLNRKYSLKDFTGTKCWKGCIVSRPVPTSISEHDDSTFPACNKHKESPCGPVSIFERNFILDFENKSVTSEFILLTCKRFVISWYLLWATMNQIQPNTKTFPGKIKLHPKSKPSSCQKLLS